MPDKSDLPDPEAWLRTLSGEELVAYRDSTEDWRDRTLADRELARRAWPNWARRIYWPLMLTLVAVGLYLILR